MSNRIYQFDLPYTISSIQVEFGIGQLKADGIFQGLPPVLQQVLQQAADNWHSVTVTGSDLDMISDPIWEQLASRLGLSYSIKPVLPSHKTVIGTTSANIGL